MSASLSIPLLWGQMFLQGVPDRFRPLIAWLYLFGEPLLTINGLLGGFILWLKVVSLLTFACWLFSWLSSALKERTVARGSFMDFALLGAIVLGFAAVFWWQLEKTERIPIYKVFGIYSVHLMGAISLAVIILWIEAALWRTIRKFGHASDVLVLLGVHLGLALGLGMGLVVRESALEMSKTNTVTPLTFVDALTIGFRVAGPFMGYVVLARLLFSILGELLAVRFRRLYAIAKVSVMESNRRMWAPWVVVTLFLVFLAFTHWFLQPPRPAEMGRLYVGTLSLLCMTLLTLMVTFLTPLSLPQDIQSQTIYTIVSKPVRRIELVWGRMIGFMSLVTVLIVFYWLISLGYLARTVGGTITATDQAAARAAQANKPTEARQLRDQAAQMRTRMTARVPVFGSLSFLDSKGTPHLTGIDVGQEQSMRQPRSHIEGATPATAIWQYGVVLDPLAPPGPRPVYLDRRIPVSDLVKPGTVEALFNDAQDTKRRIEAAEQEQASGNLSASKAAELTSTIASAKQELQTVNAEYEKLKAEAEGLEGRADAAAAAQQATEAETLRRQASRLHSPAINMEMTFNVYRTTKGRLGEPVYAEIEITNPNLPVIPKVNPYRDIIPIREYYTNKFRFPAATLAGSEGALKVEVCCLSPNQYLGMAESDLFLLSEEGNFGANFLKGFVGIWLQAMVLTAIGVFAGTFLSWPVALLTTLAFFIAGQVAFTFLLEFTNQSILGGGPFESLVRLLAHENQMSDLTPTLPVVVAKTLDALVMPFMSRLVYIVPNLNALDVTNTVADGFAVSTRDLISNTLLAFAYAVPFSIAGYFILKNREVAA